MSDSHDHAGFIAPDPADLAPLFPGYDIQALIATGGMGAVYRAVQKSLDRNVALKILPLEFSQDAAFCAGFEAEAKAMARLNHANLIGVYDFGEVNGMLFIIMEYVAGQSLYHATYGQAVDPAEVVRLVVGVCNGLAHAHENGIIHRDIKPSNILLDLNTNPKIGDFGLARPAERKIEEGEEIFGTPHYTAPEVVEAPQSVNHRADIFSVGVMLHELLTGRLPANDPRPASTIVRCDSRFDTIIRRATQPLAAARYSSAAEMARDLQAIGSSLAQKGAHAPVAAVPRRAQSRSYPVRKKQSGAPVAIMVVLGAVAAIAAYLHFSKPKPEEKVPANPDVVVLPTPPVSKNPITPVNSQALRPGEVTPPDPTPAPAPPEESTAGETPAAVPTEVTPAAVAPKFDVAGLFATARKIMQDKAKPLIATHDSNVRSNLFTYERDVLRVISRLNSGREPLEKTLQDNTGKWKAAGAKIPPSVPSGLDDLSGIQGIHDSALQRQTGFDDTFNQAIDALAATYIVGLQMRVDPLKADDPGAVELIEKEIKETKASPAYFRGLVGASGSAAASSDDD